VVRLITEVFLSIFTQEGL